MIALLSDYGASDYAGVTKGVIYSVCKKCQMVDLTHSISPQNILQAAWVLKTNYKFFPRKTIFVCLVQPGSLKADEPLIVKTKNYTFVGPNNGIMHDAVMEDGLVQAEQVVLGEKWKIAGTFQGRDLFARVAGLLEAGKKVKVKKFKQPLQQASLYLKGNIGVIANIDTFGNIITNIPAGWQKQRYKVNYDGMEALLDFHPHYSQGREGELFVIKGSSDTYEFSVKDASALERFETILAKPVIGKKIAIE